MNPADMPRIIDDIRYEGFVVKPQFIDHNGHMNVGYYGVLFDNALDVPWEKLGLGSNYVKETGCTTFSLESHFTYQREVQEGDPLDFTFRVIDVDAKRIHWFMTMLHARERWLAATCESISMCIDTATRRSTSFPADRLARLQAVHAAHSQRPRPAEVGRVIGIRRK